MNAQSDVIRRLDKVFSAISMTRWFFGASLLHPYRTIQFSLLALAILAAVIDRETLHKAVSALFFVLMAVGISVFRYLPNLSSSTPG